MVFQRERVYSAVNADELHNGDKVIGANTLSKLRERVEQFEENDVVEIGYIAPDTEARRFNEDYLLAYLVERKENCTNCGSSKCGVTFASCFHRCDNWKPKTEKKAEPHYRPFRDTDELIKVWEQKHRGVYPRPAGTMPLIWVRYKYDENNKGSLIINFYDYYVYLYEEDADFMTMYDLFNNYTFLDGSPCGVEE